MAVYFIHNDIWKRWVLRYDDETGACEELPDTGDEEVGEGRYVDPGRDLGFVFPDQPATGEFVGYYDTDDGPVFFRNERRWRMAHGAFRSEVRKSPSGYEFSLWEGQQLCLTVRYRGPVPEVDPFSYPLDEFCRDPFQWIEKYMPDPWWCSSRITLTMEAARAIVAEAQAALAAGGKPDESIHATQAMVILLEDGEAAEREAAADILAKRHFFGYNLFRRLVRKYRDRGWDASHPVVRVFTRHRGQLGNGGRAVLRHCFQADPVRQAALEPLLEPPPDR
jgi:hypothetical protein